MDGTSPAPGPNDDCQRFKFLCSFSGSILPRPQDGRLRYVGGETRIVSIPRHITYEDLMCKMKELFDNVAVLKYQQPDEELDALVSVVNDDDVINMMEEYDKLGSVDGFTRLRLFLFSQLEQDEGPPPFMEGDSERRYVDALNSLNESPDFRKHPGELGSFDDAEQYLDGRNMELPMAQMNLRHLTIPHLGSGQAQAQAQQPIGSQRFSEMEAPWSPAYYSPRQPEFPTSPSLRLPLEDYGVVLVPSGEKAAGFPGNLLHHQVGSSAYEGNSICENCRMTFQRNPQVLYPDLSERGCISPHPWTEESRHGYVMENCPSVLCGHENQHHGRSGIDYSGQVFQDQAQVSHLPFMDERGVRYGNPATFVYGPHGHMPPQSPWQNVHGPFQMGSPSYEMPISSQMVNGSLSGPMGYVRGTVESSLGVRAGVENQRSESSQKAAALDASLIPDYSHFLAVKNTPNSQFLDNVQSASLAPSGVEYQNRNGSTKLVNLNRTCGYEEIKEKNNEVKGKESGVRQDRESAFVENNGAINESKNANVLVEKPDDGQEFLPELIVSLKEAALQSSKVVNAEAQKEDTNLGSGRGSVEKEDVQNHKNGADDIVDLEVEDDSDNVDSSKIELTKAEEEALDRGLQTIKDEDLEEIRELGSGTYGAVYHGKWKGSDVAIKRIKASCFAGKPSERERLIADFWKEALILSSLHHPNVVSFYGVVRNGPDGSLATVTEFMINGSLKQFLQKKDRTIDRRKRLIIAMDAAFGMEYLHGKNIVHFDLKCENLLVNMRDPHRPVCKIGDLGLSKVKQHTLVSGGIRGTLPWMAPELLSGKSNMVTEKIDVYSFGICMWELLTGDEPYNDMHGASIIGGIVNNTLRPQIPTWCDPEWKSLMENCWASDPAQRPAFSEIAQSLRNMAAAMNLK
ncbi:Protein kinase superfamily protein with octicosapeptide/Phox/Bem1p domain [Striga hermonthica]|uniref:Protein kinase superfamily protein with octicosapeptide/Phox/Bem1p domain n=1 Tax=Striga hermonthica TaxID=68872 RepID=A0A9N7N282_STRHE|nr:Protein kinase superfamily protein with octicosapeptide/Phox/Bem1p domain [Striga hermonthica]